MKKRKNKSIKYISSILFLVIGLICGFKFNPYKDKNNVYYNSYVDEKTSFVATECTFVRAKDGDTIVVNINGKNQTVRLVEIDTPESVHPDKSRNNEDGLIASEYVKNLLVKGQTLWLSRDMTDIDKYGRLLRIVWLKEPESDTEEELINKSLNAKLLIEGYAKVVKYDDYKYQEIFKKLEK